MSRFESKAELRRAAVGVSVIQPGATIMVPEDEDRWRVVSGDRQCRYPGCGRPAIAELKRGHTQRPSWWAYCEAHLYGRVILDGRFWFAYEAFRPQEYTYVN